MSDITSRNFGCLCGPLGSMNLVSKTVWSAETTINVPIPVSSDYYMCVFKIQPTQWCNVSVGWNYDNLQNYFRTGQIGIPGGATWINTWHVADGGFLLGTFFFSALSNLRVVSQGDSYLYDYEEGNHLTSEKIGCIWIKGEALTSMNWLFGLSSGEIFLYKL